jgi:Derlin-2/3
VRSHLLGFESLLGHSVNLFDVFGIMIGHLYYFLEDLYPQISGRKLLETPRIFKVLLEQGENVVVQQ